MKDTQNDLVIVRVFNAPREVVWQAWTDPHLFKQWWGPKDFTAPVVNMDFRVGGKYLHCMRSPDGKDYWSTGVFKEIVPEEKMVITDSFADEKGQVVSSTHYGMKDFPLELLITVTFDAIDATSTRMTLVHEGLPQGEMREQCRAGWSESFDKMDAIL